MSRIIYGSQDNGSFIRTFKQEGDTTILETFQDVEPIIEQNKMLREIQNSTSKKGEVFRHVASVPVHIYEQAVREGWAQDEVAWTRWLNDPDNRVFRVYEGRL